MTDKKICKINPTRIEVYDNGIVNVKPCGVKYPEYKNGMTFEVHCDKYAERTCEYMALEHIKRQQEENEIVDEILIGLL